MGAYANFLNWIYAGPDDGWVNKNSCKTIVYGSVATASCSWGGRNPTCTGEFTEAMRELDAYCAWDDGGDISIHHWKKSYGRHNILDDY
ncbi:hypothetical protein F4805DRAFT_413080 [Annulohypoxylon moriforme]|nr:hypothetical protein F4805DRAFT_413080 [Annulohypoxylon moriforme]